MTRPGVRDRAAIAWLAYACGQCRPCIGGWETLCASQQNAGCSLDSTFAEYADAAFAMPVLASISVADAAPRVITVLRKLDEVNDAINDVLAGRIPGRVALQL